MKIIMPTPTRFTDELLQRPITSGMDVVTKLRHFARITYAVAPERIRPHVHERFELDTYTSSDGKSYVWLSVVPFEDADFHFVNLPLLKFRFGQTNYRTYVVDRETGQPAAWFFGTTLGSWSVTIPRYMWHLPWHTGDIRFDTHYNSEQGRYMHWTTCL